MRVWGILLIVPSSLGSGGVEGRRSSGVYRDGENASRGEGGREGCDGVRGAEHCRGRVHPSVVPCVLFIKQLIKAVILQGIILNGIKF